MLQSKTLLTKKSDENYDGGISTFLYLPEENKKRIYLEEEPLPRGPFEKFKVTTRGEERKIRQIFSGAVTKGPLVRIWTSECNLGLNDVLNVHIRELSVLEELFQRLLEGKEASEGRKFIFKEPYGPFYSE